MIDVKQNLKNMYFNNLECNLCGECDVQSQNHLLFCSKIISSCPEVFDNISIEHDDIYGNVEKQLAVTRLYQKIIDAIEVLSCM